MNLKLGYSSLLMMFFLVSGNAYAAGDGSPSLFSTFGALIVVLALIGVVALVLKRWAPGRTMPSDLMRLIAQLHLGAQQKICIIEVDEQWLVVGVTPQHFSLLATMPRKHVESAPQTASQFAHLLNLVSAKREKN